MSSRPDEIESLLAETIAIYNKTGSPDLDPLCRTISSLGSAASAGYWQGLVRKAADGQLPSCEWGGLGSRKILQLWPLKHRALVPRLLTLPVTDARLFASRLLAEWPDGEQLVEFEQIVRSIELGSFDWSLLRLLPAELTAPAMHRLRRVFASVTDDHSRRLICGWMSGRPDAGIVSDLALEWLKEAGPHLVYDISKLLRQPDRWRRREAIQVVRKRLLEERDEEVCAALLGLLAEHGSVDEVASALECDGRWLRSSTVIGRRHHRHHVPDAVAAALERVWPRSPRWWRQQLERRWEDAQRDRLDDLIMHMMDGGRRRSRTSVFPPRRAWWSAPPWAGRLLVDDAGIDPLRELPRFFRLPLARRVSVVEVPRLRFTFLFEEAEAANSDSAADWLRGQGIIEPGEEQTLQGDERLCDEWELRGQNAIREAVERLVQIEGPELSDATWTELEEIRAMLWPTPIEEQHPEIEPGEHAAFEPDLDAGAPALPPESAHVLATLRARLSEQSQEQLAAARRLTERTEEIVRRVAEMSDQPFPFRFPTLRLDGVLGEYHWPGSQITLYPPMINWLAHDLVRGTDRQAHEVESLLRLLVMTHESGHAVVHLGLDSNGLWWKDPGTRSLAFHESLVEWMVDAWLLPRLDLAARRIRSEVSKRLPEVYRFGSLLPDPMEPGALGAVRSLICRREARRWDSDLLALADRLLKIWSWVATSSDGTSQAFARAHRHLLDSLQGGEITLHRTRHFASFIQGIASPTCVWSRIVLEDPELAGMLLRPHELDCLVFLGVTHSARGAGESFRVQTASDVRRHADGLLLAHRDAELNRLLERVLHIDELLSQLEGGDPDDVHQAGDDEP